MQPNPAHDRAQQLPAEVIQEVLRGASDITDAAQALLGPMAEQAEELRERLLGKGWIEELDLSLADGVTVAAVDGAQVQQELYAGDLVLSVAVAAEGLRSVGPLDEAPAFGVDSRFTNHESDNDRLGKAAMVAQELSLFPQLTHDVCILDGSHQTPVIVLNSVLSSHNDTVRSSAVDLMRDLGTVDHLRSLCDPTTGGRVVASPKSDSSRDLGRLLADQLGAEATFELPATDKVLASLVLEPGEMFKAFRVPRPWSNLHIKVPDGVDDDPARTLAGDLHAAIEPLRQRSVRITYVKPPESHTAIKAEFKEVQGADYRKVVGAVLAAETPAPHLQEPFAQHLADQWAKSIGLAARAQLQSVRLDLGELADPRLLEYMLRSYRTIGG